MIRFLLNIKHYGEICKRFNGETHSPTYSHIDVEVTNVSKFYLWESRDDLLNFHNGRWTTLVVRITESCFDG